MEGAVDHALDVSDIEDTGRTRLRTGVPRVDATIEGFKARFPHLLRWLRLIGYAAAVGTVAFVGWRASHRTDFSQLSWRWIPVSAATDLVYWLCLAIGWSAVCGGRPSLVGVGLWCKTQALRYIPGGFLAPAARATAVAGRKRDKLAAIIGEAVNQLCVAVALGGLLRAAGGKPFYAVLVVALAVPFVLQHVMRGRTSLTVGRIAVSMCWYVVAFSAYAGSIYAAQAAVGPTPHGLRIAGAGVLAWAIGLVIVFAPGGVGAREAAYVGFLSGAGLAVGLPASGAVTARLVSIVVELLVLVVVVVPWRRRSAASLQPSKAGAR
ncbi:MAG: hypothetical protein DLM56_08815 [Pseudonocardiales bacterium]|nr:MAG: hypothetical protein DLM56_08815 [Pseudonocardiales bacterium]